MKRFLIFFFMVLIALTASARPPKLNVEKLFDGRYNNNKSVNNLKIIKAIADAIEKDKPRAKDYSDYQGDDGRYTSLQIVNNGETIYIGLKRDKSGGGAFFFIQGKEKAFK